MQITINGAPIQATDRIDIRVKLDGDAILPPVSVEAEGGKLQVYRSAITFGSNVNVHLFFGNAATKLNVYGIEPGTTERALLMSIPLQEGEPEERVDWLRGTIRTLLDRAGDTNIEIIREVR